MAGSSRGIVALFKSMDENSLNDDRYLTLLEENNFTVSLVPTLSFEYRTENLRERLQQPHKYSGIIFTSPRSAESVSQAMADLPCAWKEMRHYCVGIKTGETAINLLGLKNLVGQTCGNAVNLSSLIVEDFQKGCIPLPLLFPCSSLKLDTLPRTLAEHNVPFDIVNSYMTVPHPQLRDFVMQLCQKKPDYLVFFSPSGVSFSLPHLKECGLIANAKNISIGNTTAHALEEAKVGVSRICNKPTPEDLIIALNSLQIK
ncbi:uroporphyrinogen-III synthase-like [Daphnia carinata]|uniref:uroporphyrinogen-III synthase-like n=1 Tax=Daphnia carinata TaxID=120202 RepID=UPI00257BD5AA|nr:uroporphyrinogen-III synthase-like [Daphnia carinata]XP_059350486.1 uroporphyrinogen-III synthase-like [Daphnia carinata]XP_059350487.1 uroporphyrinogen-III synthase-like [Daphnia carinata]